MIKKRLYSKPEMSIVEMGHLQPILLYSGAAGAPEIDMDSEIESEFGLGDDGIFGVPGSESML